jgi:hypothetical protein
MVDKHHLLECILWPNGDGTYRKIINRAKRLKELGIYGKSKMTIPIERRLHQTMHREFEKGTEYERTGENASMYGMTGEKAPMYGRTGDKNPMYGRTGRKHPMWKGDNVEKAGAYRRALKLYKEGKISEEELQPYRDEWIEYKKARRKQTEAQHSESLQG